MSRIDFQYWASLDKWTRREAALLLDGKDPKEHPDFKVRASGVPDHYQSASRIALMLDRADWQGRFGLTKWQVSDNPLYIADVIRTSGIDLPPDLIVALRDRQARERELNADSPDNTDLTQQSALTKERQTMLKLIIGFAHGGYRMDLDSARNKHAKEMRVDLERAGVPLDDETIKKYLDEAKKLRRSLLARRGAS